jgi:hypothetical protein
MLSSTVPLLLSFLLIIIIFITIILGLDFTHEWKHAIFGVLNLSYLTQHDDLHFLQFPFKWHNFIFLYGWMTFHDIHHGFDIV